MLPNSRPAIPTEAVAEGAAVSSTRATRAPHTHLEYCCGRHMRIAYVNLVARRPRRLAPITWRLVRFLIKGVAEGATVSSTRAPHTHLECDCGRSMLIAYVDLVARHTERRAPITLRFVFLNKGFIEGAAVSSTRAPHTHLEAAAGDTCGSHTSSREGAVLGDKRHIAA